MRAIASRILVALILLQLSGCALFYRYDAISARPERDGADAPLQPRASTIQPALNIPLSSLQEAANTAAGQVLPYNDGDSARIARVEIRDPIFGSCLLCASLDANWNYTVSQPTPLRVTGGSDKLAVVLPAALGGQAGFGGDLAKLFSLDKKNFGAALEIDFKTGLKADLNFCPKLDGPFIDYRWTTDPYVELVGKTCIGGTGVCIGPWHLHLAGEIDRGVRPKLPAVAASLDQNIPCAPVRDALAKVWKGYSFPVKLPYESLYLNIAPKAMHFPGLGVTNTDVVVAGRLDADVSLDTQPSPTTTLPLPPNNPLPISPGRFSIAVPISTRYYTFEALAKQVLDQQRFAADAPFGGFRVTPTKLEVFPTADGSELAIGVSVAVEFKYLFLLNSSGTVWLTAKPEAVDNGRRIRVSNVKVTRKFDNAIWNVASVLLEEKIVGAVRDGFELDLNPPHAQAEAQLTALLNQAGQDGSITLTAKDVKLQVGRLLANDQTFQLEAILDALVEANLGRIPLR